MKLPGATALVVMLVAALATTGTCTELSEIFEQFKCTPGMLYECYRNGASYEPEGSSDVTVFLDRTQSKGHESEGYKYYAPKGSKKVTRVKFTGEYNPKTDSITDTMNGEKTTISFVTSQGNAQVYREETNGKTVQKIYDIDPKCPDAKALYEKSYKGDSSMAFTRSC